MEILDQMDQLDLQELLYVVYYCITICLYVNRELKVAQENLDLMDN